MHAIILAAGRGNRLAGFNPDDRPKCLLEFGGRSLLERQLGDLFALGVGRATLVVGHEADRVIGHVSTLSERPRVDFAYNPAFQQGSVLSLLAAQQTLTGGGPVLVLDADVLFHPLLLQRLLAAAASDVCLLDRNFEPGEEPVKIALHQGRIVEFRKRLPAGLEYDLIGESVGFFRFGAEIAAKIAQTCERYRLEGLLDAPHEEVLRDVMLAQPDTFDCVDVSGLPWIEIDFPDDIERAVKEVMPAIRADIADF